METESYSIYVLESIKNGIWYVGMSEDPEKRLIAHNKGKSKFTKGHIPWKLLYSEFVGARIEARKLEK